VDDAVDDQQRQLERAWIEETFVALQQVVDRCVASEARPRPVVAVAVVVVVNCVAVDDRRRGPS